MYKKLKEKIKKLFKKESKKEQFEAIWTKLIIKRQYLKTQDDEKSKEKLKIINRLIEKVKNKR